MAQYFKFITLLLFIPLYIYSQQENFRFDSLTVEHGLSNNNITCLIQDQQGFLWIGTIDGLNRYDGYSIREFRHDPDNFQSLSHNHIQAIYQDPADSGKVLWIGTKGGGLNKFDLETEEFTRYLHNPEDPTSLSNNDVKCIYKDNQGFYWIGTMGGGLNQFNRKNENFLSYQYDPQDPNSLSSNQVASICEDKLGNLWIGTAGGGLNKMVPESEEFGTSASTSIATETWTTHPVSEIWEFNPHDSSSGNWKRKSDMLSPRWANSACTIDDNIYVIGGIGNKKPLDTPSIANLEVYNPVKDSWDRLADMNIARAGLSASVVNGKIYVIGGSATHYIWGSSGVVVEEYNPITNTWTRKKDLPENIGYHRAEVVKDKIFVIGGASSDEPLDPYLKTVTVYDALTDSWSNRVEMKTVRADFASCVLGGKIYVMGGMEAGAKMSGLKSMEVYDPVKDSWKELKEMPGARWGHTAIVVDGKIRILGGVEKQYMQNSVFEYDPQLDDWRILPDMPLKRAFMSSGQLTGKFYFIGGTGFPTRSSASESDSLRNKKFVGYGVDRYDEHSLPSIYANSLCEDSQGTFWIGTGVGLCRFDRKLNGFVRHHFNNSNSAILNYIPVVSIYEDSKARLWISTSGGGLFQINENRERLTQYQKDLNITSKNTPKTISSLVQDRSDIIWTGTRGNGIIKLVPERKKFHHFKNFVGEGSGDSFPEVSSIFIDQNGQLWVGTAKGVLHKFDNKNQKFTQYYFDSERPITKICSAQNGELWLTRRNVLTKFDPKSENLVNYYGRWGPYQNDIPTAVYYWIDELQRKKRMIAAIEKEGSNQKITRKFEIHKETKVIIVAQGEAILNELRDRAWLTEEQNNEILWQMKADRTRIVGGVYRHKIQLDSLTLMPGKYQIHYQSNVEPVFDKWIEQASERLALWGISVFSLPSNIYRKIQPLIEKNNFKTNLLNLNGLTEVWHDRSGKPWCLIRGGIYHFDEDLKQFIHNEITIDGQVITDNKLVYQDRSGTLWFGTNDNGLIKRFTSGSDNSTTQEPQYKQYKRKLNDLNSLNSNNIHSICGDKTGNLWIGTDRGLNKFDIETEIFTHYSEKDGLSSNLILGILDDDQGILWILTSKDLSQFNPNLELFLNFDEQEDLSFAGFDECYAKGKGGEMYFGGMEGFIVFHPDSQMFNTHLPQVVITDFQIFNKSMLPGDQSPLRKSVLHSQELELKHNQDVFSFEFAALDYTNPGKNQYAHKMEGVDPDWVYTDADRRYVTYTRLEPGEYLFQVKATNNEGIWNETGTSLKIIIIPPLWRTGWAYLLYVLIIGSVIYGVWRFQTNRLKIKHQLELEKVHATKLEELDRLKSRFFANISHEFRTPLTLIQGPIKQILNGEFTGNLKKQYKMILRNSDRLLNLVNQLLDLAKLEDGKLKIRAQKTEIISLLKGLVQAFESLAKLKNITLRFHSEPDSIELYVDREKFKKIINNLLSNAFKFTPKGGKVIVDFRSWNAGLIDNSKFQNLKSKILEIRISNTGSGIPPEHLNKIFDRFYQADNFYKKDSESSGIGLSLTRELVIACHGEIQVESEMNKITTFTVMLPIGKEHLKAEEIIEETETEEWRPKTGELPLSSIETIEVHSISPGRSPVSGLQFPLLLIVEDNPDVTEYISSFLEKDYRIIAAEDGKAGCKIALGNYPDLIISDVMMPEMDGFELCHKLKSNESTSHIPIILLTAKAGMDSKIEGLEFGADDYISKPFDAKELHIRVKNLIEQRKKLRDKFTQTIEIQPGEIAASSMDEQFLKRLLNVFEDHVAESDFSTEDFAREVGMSRSNLHRKLQALTNQPTHEFLRSLRLKRAAQLLKKSAGTVTDIAYEVGFSNPSYFSKMFRQQFGQTPSEFANKNQ